VDTVRIIGHAELHNAGPWIQNHRIYRMKTIKKKTNTNLTNTATANITVACNELIILPGHNLHDLISPRADVGLITIFHIPHPD
jgi:hypothetical protein